MATYLLAWNPKNWYWADQAEARVAARSGGYSIFWACATKNVQPDDRVFLVKLGPEPRGLIGAGRATGPTTERRHYNPERAARGDVYRFLPVCFDALLDPDEAILDHATLKTGALAKMHWSPQQSGTRIPDDVAIVLERKWAALLADGAVIEAAALEGQRQEATYYRLARNRALRDRALAMAGGVCGACGTDYSKVLDGMGTRVLQVHHKKQLASRDRPALTRLSDLAVICANCHMLIHTDPQQAITVEDLRRRLLATPRR